MCERRLGSYGSQQPSSAVYPAVLVDDAVVRDREDPPTQVVLITAESLETTHHVDENVAEHVFAVDDARGTEVVVHRARVLSERVFDGRLVRGRSGRARRDLHRSK